MRYALCFAFACAEQPPPSGGAGVALGPGPGAPVPVPVTPPPPPSEQPHTATRGVSMRPATFFGDPYSECTSYWGQPHSASRALQILACRPVLSARLIQGVTRLMPLGFVCLSAFNPPPPEQRFNNAKPQSKTGDYNGTTAMATTAAVVVVGGVDSVPEQPQPPRAKGGADGAVGRQCDPGHLHYGTWRRPRAGTDCTCHSCILAAPFCR
jgi:hypothetical protein